MIFWPRCFAQTPIFQAVYKVALILTMSIEVCLVSVVLAKDDTEYNEEVMSPKSTFLVTVVESLDRKQEVLTRYRFCCNMFGADFQRHGPCSFRISTMGSRFERSHVVSYNFLSTNPQILLGNMCTSNTVWCDWFKLSQKERQRHHNSNNLKGNFAVNYRNWSKTSFITHGLLDLSLK